MINPTDKLVDFTTLLLAVNMANETSTMAVKKYPIKADLAKLMDSYVRLGTLVYEQLRQPSCCEEK